MPDTLRAVTPERGRILSPGDAAHHQTGRGSEAPSAGADPGPPLPALPSRWSRAWIAVILVLTVGAAGASLIGVPPPIRPVLTLGFAIICPGMALVRLLRLEQPLMETTIAIALSIALAGLVSGILLYLGSWSPGWSLSILVAVALAGLALDPLLVPRRAWATLWRGAIARVELLAGVAAPDEGAEQTQVALAAPVVEQRGRPRRPTEQLPPPPLAIVRRRGPTAPTPVPRGAHRRSRLGLDPLDETETGRQLRDALDTAIEDLVERRDESPE